MQAMTIIDISVILILSTISIRAAISVYSFTHRALYFSRVDKEYRKQFESYASLVSQKIKIKQDANEPSWNGRRKFRVVWRTPETPNGDICSFFLVPADKRPLPRFNPGQFLTFEVPVPGQAQKVTRCYSLSECPIERRYYRISVKRLLAPPQAPPGTPPGLSSNYFHDAVQEGDVIDVFAPAGEFCLHKYSQRPVVLIAGGVGITPLLSMVNWLAAIKSRREVWLFYGVRNRSDHAMYSHLKTLQRENPNIRVVTFYSEPTAMCRRGIDYHVEGFVSVDVIKAVLKAPYHEFYVCGPPPMMKVVTDGLAAWGVPDQDVMTESFGPASTAAQDPEHPNDLSAQDTGDAETRDIVEIYDIVLARSKKTLQWTPEAGTLLELAEENGIPLRSGCRVGNCGTCTTALARGQVDYVRRPGRQLEANSCLACIARPKSDLVLDL